MDKIELTTEEQKDIREMEAKIGLLKMELADVAFSEIVIQQRKGAAAKALSDASDAFMGRIKLALSSRNIDEQAKWNLNFDSMTLERIE